MRLHGRRIRKWLWQAASRRKRGQISMLVVFSFIPMFTLFAFVINIGMLVNAKISLQNAADLAAYAGAATQARWMTNISHLNYYMRMTYKRFIAKYYTLGNFSQRCYPRQNMPPECGSQADSTDRFDWVNIDYRGQTKGFPGVPAVCLSVSNASNPCQLAEFVRIVAPPPCGMSDPACQALREAARGIGDIQTKACENSSQLNQTVIMYWLFATNYDLQLQQNANLQGLISNDIGLMTEEILTLERIRNLKDIINAPPQRNVTKARADRFAEDQDPAKLERTALAFHTAVGNLNSTVFDHQSVSMTELLPSVEMLTLKEMRLRDFKVAFTSMEKVEGPPPRCTMALRYFDADPTVGVVKDKQSHVYYAVKLTAKAKLLFNPFPFGNPAEEIELTAYAAAKPFGSRIGPDLYEVAEEHFLNAQGLANPMDANGNPVPTPMKYPRLIIDNNGHTTESKDYLKAMSKLLTEGQSAGSIAAGTVGKQGMDRLLHAAMLPDEYEIGKYNIPVDSDAVDQTAGDSRFLNYFILDQGDDPRSPEPGRDDSTYSFWAPLIAMNGFNRFQDTVNTALDLIITNAGSAGSSQAGGGAAGLTNNAQLRKADLAAGFGQFMSTLGQRGERNVFKMPDPLARHFFRSSQGGYPTIPGKVASASLSAVAPKLASSFTTMHDARYYRSGRDGYSVKLIPFKSLFSQPGKIRNGNDSAHWAPLTESFNGDATDLNKAQH